MQVDAKNKGLRNIRVGDELWQQAMGKALDEGTTISAVIRDALRTYIDPPVVMCGAEMQFGAEWHVCDLDKGHEPAMHSCSASNCEAKWTA